MAYVINEDCISCEACEPACPTWAITMTGSTSSNGMAMAVVEGGKCIECGDCFYICPVDAPNPE